MHWTLFDYTFSLPKELEYHPVLLYAQEGRQGETDGLLPGAFSFHSFVLCQCERTLPHQAGIGTYTVPQIATPLMTRIAKTIDMAIANDLDAHVMGKRPAYDHL